MPKITGLAEITVPSRLAPAPPEHKLSPQQEDALDFVRDPLGGNAILEAVAGAGKTSTLVEMCKHLDGSAAFTAFNKKIADEIGGKLVTAGVDKTSVRAGTFHSFGFAAWRKVAPNVRVEGEKTTQILAGERVPKNLHPFVKSLVSLAKQRAIGILVDFDDWSAWEAIVEHHDLTEKLYQDGDFDSDSEEDLVLQGIEAAQSVLRRSLDMDTKIIDFDDMIYSPLVHQSPMWKYDWVMIDEAQDTNPARRALAATMLKPGGRLVAVGDPRQAIYGFTGADADALDQIHTTFSCKKLPLTVSYRCAKAVVRHAQEIVSHIEAFDGAPEGSVTFVDRTDSKLFTPVPGDAIICRVTKPLIELAFDFIRRRIPAHVEGRDIGASLAALVKKWRSPQTVGELADKLDEHLMRETLKFIERDQQAKAAQLQDRVQSLKVIMSTLHDDDPPSRVLEVIDQIFKDTDGRPVRSITLSTVHKAKGREWDKVWLYGRNVYMPHQFARQLWEIEQEHNLIYVGITRAKRDLVEVSLPSQKKW
jgi:DNA helicase II / ATP-dependent DNA helicase PcrA